MVRRPARCAVAGASAVARRQRGEGLPASSPQHPTKRVIRTHRGHNVVRALKEQGELTDSIPCTLFD